MDNMMKDLTELCETISRSISTANEKIRGAGGKLSTGDVDYVDKLTHSLKSIKAVMAMDEAADDMDDYSERYSRGYDRGGSYRGGNSYAPSRGRGRYANRDSMGRYSRDDGSYRMGYSRDGGMVDELRELMDDAPNEQIKQDMKRLIEKIESR